MAKPKQNESQNKTQEKRGGIIGFFESIRDFFKNLWEKITMAMEFNKRVENGKKYWENSPEGQAQKETQEMNEHFGFHSRDEWEQSAEHFFGYYEMQMSESGLLRIPEKTELIWHHVSPEADAQRYLTAMEERFSDRPSPIQSHNGQAFSEIAGDMKIAAHRNDTSLHQFVLGGTHIVAQVQDGKINLSISDGTTTKQFVGQEPNQVADLIMKAYTEISAPGRDTIYINPQTGTKSICTPNEQGHDVFTAHAVANWKGEGDNKQKYMIKGVMEITGTALPSQAVTQDMVNGQQSAGMPEPYDLQKLARTAYTQAEKNGTSSMFIIGDKMLWAQNDNGNIVLNLAPHSPQCEVAPITIATNKGWKLDPKDRDEKPIYCVDKEGKPKFSRMCEALQKGWTALDAREAHQLQLNLVHFTQGLHPKTEQFAALAQQCVDGIGTTYPDGFKGNVIICQSPEPSKHTAVFVGIEHLDENGAVVQDARISLDGEVLYHVASERAEDGSITITQKGMFDSKEDALKHIAEQTRGATWTREHMGVDMKELAKLPPNLREQLPQEYKDELEAFEHPEASADGHEHSDIDTHDDQVL